MKRWIIAFSVIIVVVTVMIWQWPAIINLMMPADSRPHQVGFLSEQHSDMSFEKKVQELESRYDLEFAHIRHFRDAGIRSYDGPRTCLTCHESITVTDASSAEGKEIGLMENILTSAHYTFFTKSHDNVYGFNGEKADDFAMGKINRPCPKPGSFAMTAWAELSVTTKGDTLSEGCGQCHIGGQYQAPLGEMMPGYRTLASESEAIDCLICHSRAYDMNRKQVVRDENGLRWDQDRSLAAALAVTKTTSQTCLRCHQHNFGGDIYVDPADSSFMESLLNTGYDRPRVLHPGSKRGTPYSPSWDVHAAAGLNCTDCHTTEGHYIAKGRHTTTMMANDLPDVDVSCENCHTAEAHSENEALADYLNMHNEKIACQTCHIPSLHEDNATRRDFAHPEFEEHPGIYIYTDVEKNTLPGQGIAYVWWNGDATFLGNPIGDNPNGADLYRFYTADSVWPEFKEFDYAAWYEDVMRPISKQKPSRLYAMKIFNGRQHIDLNNITPFGGMYLPYNLPTYYASGNPDSAAIREMEKSMMKEMYGTMFKYYMMDRFMRYMNADEWNAGRYNETLRLENVEPRWLPNDAMLEISHAIRRDGALSCGDCHSKSGVLDWQFLGYTADEIETLSENPLVY